MFIWRQLCFIQFAILLFVYAFLGLTGTPENYVPMFNDKLMHCSGYIVAAFSISFAFPRWQFWKRAIFLIAFSIGIEIGQYFLPPRTFDFFDICANSTGVITGLGLVFLLEKYISWFKYLLFLKEKSQ
jgi:glycopeptide antibiotics resistance protein